MEKYYILVLILYISSQVNAQEWSKEDSVWLKNVLSGEEKLQLNDETKKAIKSGNLLSPDPLVNKQLKLNQAELPITKSFEGITMPENRRKQPHELSPQVFKLYNMEILDSLPNANISTTFYGKTNTELHNIEKLTPRKAAVNDNTSIRSGSSGFSTEDILRTIFWPSHRAKKRNKKNANSWKNYNNGY